MSSRGGDFVLKWQIPISASLNSVPCPGASGGLPTPFLTTPSDAQPRSRSEPPRTFSSNKPFGDSTKEMNRNFAHVMRGYRTLPSFAEVGDFQPSRNATYPHYISLKHICRRRFEIVEELLTGIHSPTERALDRARDRDHCRRCSTREPRTLPWLNGPARLSPCVVFMEGIPKQRLQDATSPLPDCNA
jgi:hypothetical protein